ncbi:hypothetical protein [Asticcacaulis sp.]|uniref:hypothetical protein n=1 Tax=Asticcacaulis sp. TaxID=1872648 RepID=UPI002616BF8E|nr:hypothetical protein [Asticcacaulis sp.]
MAGAITVRGAAVVTCSMLAGACVGAFLFPVLAPAGAAGAASTALMTAGGGLGGNLLASWIDRYGPDKLQSLLTGPLSLPKHDDMVRVADLALSCALKTLLTEYGQEFTQGGKAGDDLRACLEQWRKQAESHTRRVPVAEVNDAITTALARLSGPDPAQALNLLLADAIAPDMRHTTDAGYMAAWQRLANRLSARLPDLLSAYVAEALKTDERFFRAVTLTRQSALVQTGQDVLAAVQAQGERLQDLQAALKAQLDQNQGQDNLADFRAAITAQLSALQSAIKVEFDNDRAPPLTWPKPTQQTGQELSLLYYDRKARFVGRDAALAALNQFIDDPAPVLWTSITGGAGVGKSRLVLEALSLRRLTGGVVATFLPPSAGWLANKRYENWRAPEPTVLIIDYAGVSPALVRAPIDNLACRAGTQSLRAPVRLLLLDTQPNQGEFALPNRIKDSTEKGRRAASVEWSDAGRAALDLRPLSDADLFTITAIYREADLTEAEVGKVTAAVRADAELGRPLFAALMGLALRHGTDTPLTLAGVTSHFLDRQERHWMERDQITPLDRTLLALATLGGSVPLVEVLTDPLLADLLPITGKPHRPTLRQHWSVMTGKPLPTDHVTKLEPDYVGGLYLLRHLKQAAPDDPRQPNEVAAEIERLITLAWKYGDPGEPLINLARNFAGEKALVPLVAELAAWRPNEERWSEWAAPIPTIALRLAQTQAHAAVDHIVDALIATVNELDARHSSSAASSVGDHNISTVADSHPVQPRLLLLNAKVIAKRYAITCLNILFFPVPNAAFANKLLGGLRRVAEAYSDDTEARVLLARGLRNASNHAKPNNWRDELIDEIQNIQNSNPDNIIIGEELASSLVNAIYDSENNINRVESLYGTIKKFSENFDKYIGIQRLLSTGIQNALYHIKSDNNRVITLAEDARSVYKKNPHDYYIAYQFSSISATIVTNRDVSLSQKVRIINDIRHLVKCHNYEKSMVYIYAVCLANAFLHTIKRNRCSITIVKELRHLDSKFPNDSDLSLIIAKGLVNAMVWPTVNQKILDSLIMSLKEINRRHTKNTEIRTQLAYGLLNSFRIAQNTRKSIRKYVRYTEEFVALYPGEPLVRSEMLPLLKIINGTRRI